MGQFEYKSDYCRREAARSHNFVFGNAHRLGGNQESSVSLATLRLDGFVSLTAGDGPMTTKPLVFHGERLEINVATGGPQGEVAAVCFVGATLVVALFLRTAETVRRPLPGGVPDRDPVWNEEGTHKGCPYGLHISERDDRRRQPRSFQMVNPLMSRSRLERGLSSKLKIKDPDRQLTRAMGV